MRNSKPSSLPNRALGAMLFARTVSNINYRIVYPFLPAIARGLDVSLEAAGRLVSIQGGIGLVAPLFGHLSDRYGRRWMMEIALLLLAVASGLVYVVEAYVPVLFAFAGIGIAKALYDPAMQAYVGDVVPYARRGRIIAITELAWSFAWLFGVPIAGLLIERTGWQAPWAMIAILALLGAAATHWFLPSARRIDGQEGTDAPASWWELLHHNPIRAALFTAFGMLFAIENVFIVYGAFLEDRFGLAIGAIGVVSVVIGIAELLAEGGAAAWTDRLGKKRSIIMGLLTFAASLLLLATLSGQLVTVLGSFALAILFFEFTIVSFLPLMTELAPAARATLLSMNIAAMGLGRLFAPILGTTLYERMGSLLPNTLLSALVCLFCAFVMWRGVEEVEEDLLSVR
ncbi:MAG: MFS transporter [Chloroflexota bacterium]|nr:MFS transporter [Chloroflexota bacterium]